MHGSAQGLLPVSCSENHVVMEIEAMVKMHSSPWVISQALSMILCLHQLLLDHDPVSAFEKNTECDIYGNGK